MNGYLRIGELSRRTGVSPELLRAWESRYGLLEPSRSPGGFRLYSDMDVARVLRTRDLIAQGVSAAEAARRALMPGEQMAEVAGSRSAAADLIPRLSAALDAFDEPAAHQVIDELFARFSIESALRDVVMPYLRRLGERWGSGEVSVGQEHFASNLIRGRLLGLARGWGSSVGSTLLLACPPGEEHELGLMAFGIVAARRGYRVVYLGPNTPFETMQASALAVRPQLIVLSISDPERLADYAQELRSLAGVSPLAVGGTLPEEGGLPSEVVRLEQDPVSAALAVTS